MITEKTFWIIFSSIYIITFLLFVKGCYKMHKNNDSDDPFLGSHIVVALFFIGLIPLVNTIIGIFLLMIQFLEYLKKR